MHLFYSVSSFQFIAHNPAAQALVEKLRRDILVNHTLNSRAQELVAHLKPFGVELKRNAVKSGDRRSLRGRVKAPDRGHGSSDSSKSAQFADQDNGKSTSEPNSGRPCVCVGVRTIESHTASIEILVRSMLTDHMRAVAQGEAPPPVGMHVFIMDTEDKSPDFAAKLVDIVVRLNNEVKDDVVHVVRDNDAPKRQHPNPFYGYDSTDQLLRLMLGLPQCKWIMFTNGDNMYNGAWFESIQPSLINPAVDVIGWDFVTHHSRHGSGQQVIRVALVRKFVDLGR